MGQTDMGQGTCTYADCCDPRYALDLCSKHYQRVRRHGDPSVRFPRQPEEQRFFAKVIEGPGDCWYWDGHVSAKGYGSFGLTGPERRGKMQAHRWSYEYFCAPIPDGLTIDHLCHTADNSCQGGDNCPHRRCVNPWHMEPVPAEVNKGRSRLSISAINKAKTCCKRGHEFNEANTMLLPNGGRRCRPCKNDNARRVRGRRISARA